MKRFFKVLVTIILVTLVFSMVTPALAAVLPTYQFKVLGNEIWGCKNNSAMGRIVLFSEFLEVDGMIFFIQSSYDDLVRMVNWKNDTSTMPKFPEGITLDAFEHAGVWADDGFYAIYKDQEGTQMLATSIPKKDGFKVVDVPTHTNFYILDGRFFFFDGAASTVTTYNPAKDKKPGKAVEVVSLYDGVTYLGIVTQKAFTYTAGGKDVVFKDLSVGSEMVFYEGFFTVTGEDGFTTIIVPEPLSEADFEAFINGKRPVDPVN